MPEVGHETNGHGKSRSTYISIALQFLIAVLLAFIGFTLQQLHADTENSLKIAQENQVAIGTIDSKLDGINGRLERLERAQDARP